MPSFVLTHDALLGALTDVEPWTAYWDRLVRVELGWPFTRRTDPDVSAASEKSSTSHQISASNHISASNQISAREPLSSLARLTEFVPRLLELDVSGNHIAYLTGVPSALRVLEARGCKLTDTCGWGGLRHLERLDVGGQKGEGIHSLTQMSCLGRLTTLIAPHNKISSLDGILGLRHLVKLDLSYNRLQGVVEMGKKWDKLEELVLRGNKKMRGLRVALRGVMLVDVEECGLEDVVFEAADKVRVLRVSNNRLTRLDVSMLGALRTLYADGNALSEVCMGRGTRVEAVSLRYNTSTITLPVAPRDAKRLYVSGTLHPPLPTTPFYALTYFEAAHCGLTTLPALGDVAPNLRTVNLNWNFLEGLGGLKGCGRVRKMSAVGNRVGSVRRLVKDIKAMSELEVVDVRGNPCVGGWYLPLVDEGSDAAWRRTLPNKVYAGRLAYRGLVMAGAAHLRVLDGVSVTRKERDKAGELVRRLTEIGRGDLGPEM
ncbi:L domain-like protein [Hymenopellis radicata]|nr:L domain-like protein [Hymenopellis radicata]